MSNNPDTPLKSIVDNVKTWIKTGDEHVLRRIIQEINNASTATKREELSKVVGETAGVQVAQNILKAGTNESLRLYGKRLGKLLNDTESKTAYYAISRLRENIEKVESPFSHKNNDDKFRLYKEVQMELVRAVSDPIYRSSMTDERKIDYLMNNLTDYERYASFKPRTIAKTEQPPTPIENKLPEKLKLDIEGFRKRIWCIDETANTKKLKN